jgi:hypothetical protein
MDRQKSKFSKFCSIYWSLLLIDKLPSNAMGGISGVGQLRK